jgi:NADP-dependent 3-hydroxy acid dehydrogenase YdfG
MENIMQDKVIIVTGASSGIGLAAVRMLSKAGAKVVLAAPASEALTQVSAELASSLSIPTDITNEASVRAMIRQAHKHFGRVDVLINNAGRGYEGSLEFVETDKFLYLFRLHVLGPLAAMQEAIPIMRAQGSGRIINVSSPTSKLILPRLGAYSATKVALRCITLTARKELAADNIAVSVFYPFITASNFGKNVFHTQEKSTATERAMTLPDADSTEITAAKLVAAIGSDKAEIVARGLMYFVVGIMKKKLTGSNVKT